MKTSVKFICAVISCLVAISPLFAAGESAPAETADKGYKLVSQSDTVAFYADLSTGGFYLLNKNDSKKWYSTPRNPELDEISKGKLKLQTQSELVIEYIAVEDENVNSSTQLGNTKIDAVQNGKVTVTEINNGIKVVYDFANLDMVIPVTYTLKDDCLEASVLVSELDEGEKNYIVSVDLLPYFGAATPSDNGYIFVPDGCGAVAEFNNNVVPSHFYEKSVYGDDMGYVDEGKSAENENILFPVFGMVYDTKSALMGVVTEGDAGAAISVKTGSSETYYNTVNSKMMNKIYSTGQSLYVNNKTDDISTITHTPFGVDNYTVRYYPLCGADADYGGMAKIYRNYLIDEKGLEKNPKAPTLALDVYGSLKTKANFLGITYYKKRVLTDFEAAEKIAAELKESRIDNLALRYIGWQNDGVYNTKISKKAKPMSILGGKKDFLSLNESLIEYGYEFYPTVDLFTYQKSGNGVSKRTDSAKAPNGDIAFQNQYSIVTFEPLKNVKPWAVVTPSMFLKVADKYLKNYKKLKLDSISLSEIGDYIYSDFSKKDGIYKAKSAVYAVEMLKKVKKEVSSLAISGGNGYAVPFADRIFSLPTTSSGYDIFEYDVPFVQMVLHGYVPYTTDYVRQSSDMQMTFLKSLETGSDLLFSCVGDDTYPLSETRLSGLFSSEFSLWKDTAVELYKKQSAVQSLVYDCEIISHSRIEDDLFKVVYSDNTEVFVNYSDTEKSVDGIKVSAFDYAVREAEQ